MIVSLSKQEYEDLRAQSLTSKAPGMELGYQIVRHLRKRCPEGRDLDLTTPWTPGATADGGFALQTRKDQR